MSRPEDEDTGGRTQHRGPKATPTDHHTDERQQAPQDFGSNQDRMQSLPTSTDPTAPADEPGTSIPGGVSVEGSAAHVSIQVTREALLNAGVPRGELTLSYDRPEHQDVMHPIVEDLADRFPYLDVQTVHASCKESAFSLNFDPDAWSHPTLVAHGSLLFMDAATRRANGPRATAADDALTAAGFTFGQDSGADIEALLTVAQTASGDVGAAVLAHAVECGTNHQSADPQALTQQHPGLATSRGLPGRVATAILGLRGDVAQDVTVGGVVVQDLTLPQQALTVRAVGRTTPDGLEVAVSLLDHQGNSGFEHAFSFPGYQPSPLTFSAGGRGFFAHGGQGDTYGVQITRHARPVGAGDLVLMRAVKPDGPFGPLRRVILDGQFASAADPKATWGATAGIVASEQSRAAADDPMGQDRIAVQSAISRIVQQAVDAGVLDPDLASQAAAAAASLAATAALDPNDPSQARLFEPVLVFAAALQTATAGATRTTQPPQTSIPDGDVSAITTNRYTGFNASDSHLQDPVASLTAAVSRADWAAAGRDGARLLRGFESWTQDALQASGDLASAKQLGAFGDHRNDLDRIEAATETRFRVAAVVTRADNAEDGGPRVVPLTLYAYATDTTWVLEQVGLGEASFSVNVPKGEQATPPAALFDQIATVSVLPACTIHWSVPDATSGNVAVSGEWTWWEWVRVVGGVLGVAALAGLAIASGVGAPVGVSMLIAGAGLLAGAAGAVAAAGELADRSAEGTLDSTTATLDALEIAACLLSFGAAGAGSIVAAGARGTLAGSSLLKSGSAVYRTLTAANLAIDGVTFLVSTRDAYAQLQGVLHGQSIETLANDPQRRDAILRLVGMWAASGALLVIGARGDVGDLSGNLVLRGPRPQLDPDSADGRHVAQAAQATQGARGRVDAIVAEIDPAAQPLIDDAFRAARSLNPEDMDRLHARAVDEGHLSADQADALWDELNVVYRAQPLGGVQMPGESHTLRQGGKGDRVFIELCSDCKALHLTTRWLLDHPDVLDQPGLRERVEALHSSTTAANDALNQGRPVDVDSLSRQLQDLGETYNISCLSCLADAGPNADSPGFVSALDLNGQALDDVRHEPFFQDNYEVYEVGGVQRLRRKPGTTQDTPMMRLDEQGRVVFNRQVKRDGRLVDLDPSRNSADVTAELLEHAPSLAQYKAATAETLGWTDATFRRWVDEVVAEYRAGRKAPSVANLRHSLKQRMRRQLLDDVFADADPGLAHQRILDVTEGMNSSDAGNVTEAWVARYRREFQGVDPKDQVSHTTLDPRQNPAMTDGKTRDVDQGLYDSDKTLMLNEVKSGGGRLDPVADAPQIEAGLAAVAQERDRTTGRPAGAAVTMRGGVTEYSDTYQVTIVDVRKARASVEQLEDWMRRYSDEFVLEIFDSNGRAQTVNADYLEGSGLSLAEYLNEL